MLVQKRFQMQTAYLTPLLLHCVVSFDISSVFFYTFMRFIIVISLDMQRSNMWSKWMRLFLCYLFNCFLFYVFLAFLRAFHNKRGKLLEFMWQSTNNNKQRLCVFFVKASVDAPFVLVCVCYKSFSGDITSIWREMHRSLCTFGDTFAIVAIAGKSGTETYLLFQFISNLDAMHFCSLQSVAFSWICGRALEECDSSNNGLLTLNCLHKLCLRVQCILFQLMWILWNCSQPSSGYLENWFYFMLWGKILCFEHEQYCVYCVAYTLNEKQIDVP